MKLFLILAHFSMTGAFSARIRLAHYSARCHFPILEKWSYFWCWRIYRWLTHYSSKCWRTFRYWKTAVKIGETRLKWTFFIADAFLDGWRTSGVHLNNSNSRLKMPEIPKIPLPVRHNFGSFYTNSL